MFGQPGSPRKFWGNPFNQKSKTHGVNCATHTTHGQETKNNNRQYTSCIITHLKSKNSLINTLRGTNISPGKSSLKMIFIFPKEVGCVFPRGNMFLGDLTI